ncbi:MAG: FAD-binding and (Fe-S)-binding domain-containing protein, partial [Nitriliruptoraceae bacterium]
MTDADATPRRRAEYASDASLYRVVPQVVVFPRDADEVVAVMAVAADTGAVVTPRGAGTSVAGNAIGPGIVLDLRRHMGDRVHVDPHERTATIDPGVVLDDLQRAAAGHGLRFGPDPSTHDRCTLGGMIGNNACGARAVAHGTTADNVVDLTIVDGTGWHGRVADHPAPGLDALRQTYATAIRTHLGQFPRQLSGYGLAALLPEGGASLTRAFVGTEGTCGVVTSATVRLVPRPSHRVLVVLGFGDLATAADAAPQVVAHRPEAVEGFDQRLVAAARRRLRAVPQLPHGRAWLLVELAGENPDVLLARARGLVDDLGGVPNVVFDDEASVRALWSVREAGAGLLTRSGPRPTHAGWEDAAVPPGVLGDYLRAFEALLDDHGLTGAPYGHFGDGCVHVRLDFPFDADGSRTAFRAFLEEATRLVARFGGSMSGEHGDGRARSELLRLRYPAVVLDAFRAFAEIFDPDDRCNPGVIVDPVAVDDDLRPLRIPLAAATSALSVRAPGESLAGAVHRCVGIGACVSTASGAARVMCPSYAATGDERDATRGRARVLQDAVTGAFGPGGRGALDRPEVRDALEWCLGCKACASDCPTGVDMAAYRIDALSQTYAGRVRPRTHYTLGWLHRWLALAAPVARLVNGALSVPRVARTFARLGGIDPSRQLPHLATRRVDRGVRVAEPGADALLWVDTFTEYLAPQLVDAARRVLTDSGFAVRISPRGACCGLPLISTGQLSAARRRAAHTVEELTGMTRADTLVVGLEPSCVAALREDIPRLVDTDAASELAGRVRTVAEALATRRGTWAPPRLDGQTFVVQVHCHQHAVLGFDADRAVLAAAGARIVEAGGCCGLAGDFGLTQGRAGISAAVAA